MTKGSGSILLIEHQAPPPTPPPPTRLIDAIDVSSAQGLDIGPLIDQYKPKHVIVKLYQSVELGGNGARFSVEQAKTAQRKGCTTSGYVWLYAGINGAKQVTDALNTASQAQLPLNARNPLWLDCEDYTDGSYPSIVVIDQAVAECERRGVACGIYTGGWWWKPRTGNCQAYAALPLWASIYDGDAHLVGPLFGGWQTLAGKQWSGSPIDRSVFRAEFATP